MTVRTVEINSLLDREILFASLDLGDIKHLVDQAEKMLSAAADRADVFKLIGDWVTQAQEFGGCQNDAEGRTDSVAHISQERALGRVGGLGLISRVNQLGGSLRHQASQVPLVFL